MSNRGLDCHGISNDNWFVTYHPQIGNVLNKLSADDIITKNR